MKKEILVALAWATAIVIVALAARFAREHGYIDPETTKRVVAMNGLVIAYYGNRAPKAIAPSALARQVARFSGWVLALSGLVYAGFWAFAPLPLAMTIGTGGLAAGVIMVIGYCIGLRTKLGNDGSAA
ncbi:hypothetical protein LJR016_000467 [Devosia sp. LjRoot16]|uniref:hypothetical protein n=1 Tax=Devosia sp. LjRoot16 TaxID=3342271 RepID=UPI003ED14326